MVVESSKTAITKPFPDVFGSPNYALPPLRTLNELLMVTLSSNFRIRHEWWRKYKIPETRAQWREEALNTRMVWIERETRLVSTKAARELFDKDPELFKYKGIDQSIVRLTEEEVEYLLDELDGYARLLDEETGIQVSCFDGIWHSDSLIGDELPTLLRKGVAVLEDVPDSEKYRKPNSDRQVLHLVDPSLYCVVYNRTVVIPCSDSGEKGAEVRLLTIPQFVRSQEPEIRSKRFQWLPTDFSICGGAKVKALGYINNLPCHAGLYKVMENLLEKFVPLFERVLTDMLNPLPHRLPGNYRPPKEADPSYPQRNPSQFFWTYVSEVDEYYHTLWKESKVKPVALPKLPEGGYSGGLEKCDNVVSLLGRTVQVVVKLTNIRLTPENPEYKASVWRVEGMVNERIVASGYYFYDQENVTGSELAFRIAVGEPEDLGDPLNKEYDSHARYKTWGMIMNNADSTTLNNVVGATAIKQGRCVAFPNTCQHRISSFRLADPSKPGHIKILSFFLVDPNIKTPIPSTSTVPPQQRKWLEQALHDARPDPDSLLRKLPAELLSEISLELGPGTMSEEEAERFRKEVEEERSAKDEYLNRRPWFYGGWQDESLSPSPRGLFARLFGYCWR